MRPSCSSAATDVASHPKPSFYARSPFAVERNFLLKKENSKKRSVFRNKYFQGDLERSIVNLVLFELLSGFELRFLFRDANWECDTVQSNF